MFAFNCLPVGCGDYNFHAALQAAKKIFPTLVCSDSFPLGEELAWELLADLKGQGVMLDAKLDSSGKRLADPSFVVLPNNHILYLSAGLYYITVWNSKPL